MGPHLPRRLDQPFHRPRCPHCCPKSPATPHRCVFAGLLSLLAAAMTLPLQAADFEPCTPTFHPQAFPPWPRSWPTLASPPGCCHRQLTLPAARPSRRCLAQRISRLLLLWPTVRNSSLVFLSPLCCRGIVVHARFSCLPCAAAVSGCCSSLVIWGILSPHYAARCGSGRNRCRGPPSGRPATSRPRLDRPGPGVGWRQPLRQGLTWRLGGTRRRAEAGAAS